jgi:hypothetical protein
MVPADRAAPSVPDRSTDPDGSRGIPLSEPTTSRRAGAAEAPALDSTAAE